jgi:pantothenate kinase type III
LINGIIEKTINEKKYLPTIILTGGLAITFKEQIEMKCYYEPHLTLQGLYLIGLKKNA